MKINFLQENKSKKYLTNLINVCCTALKILRVPCNDTELNLSFLTKKEIKKVNKNFRNTNKVTDVISFPNLLETGDSISPINTKITKKNYMYDIIPETGNIFLGDILLCLPQAKKQSKKYNNTLGRELSYLTVHAILHLMGYDHINENDKILMRSVEEKILKQLEITK